MNNNKSKVEVWLTPEIKEIFKKLARHGGMTSAELMRRLIDNYIEMKELKGKE